MGVEQAPTKKGKESAEGLQSSATREEKKLEARKGSDLPKGAERFEERSKSSDGKTAATKQKPKR